MRKPRRGRMWRREKRLHRGSPAKRRHKRLCDAVIAHVRSDTTIRTGTAAGPPNLRHLENPNLTDKKHPGNPTLSYRSKNPLRVIGEVIDWQGHSVDELNHMKANVERLRQSGIEAIED